MCKYAAAQEQPGIKQQADKLFERYEYFKSLGLYLKLDKGAKTNVQVLERIAASYSNLNDYKRAAMFYGRAVANAKASKISHYYYAEALQNEEQLDSAKQQYRLYFGSDPAALKGKLASCDSALLWMAEKTGFKVFNEKALNTEYSDWGLTYEGKTGFIFTSDRVRNDDGTDDRTGNSWFKLYQSKPNSSTVTDLAPFTDDGNIFNSSYHAGPMALNPTADTAYITVSTELPKKKIALDKRDLDTKQRLYTRRLQLVMACKRNGQWTVFASFPYNNVQLYSLGDAALAKDGRTIYFTSDMPGGEGKTDIWYCEKKADGTWGDPVNCGKTINTSDDEAFPTISGDGALYYSSKGFTGMGGLDIYKSKGEKNHWTTPQNLKYPINSTGDDFYLTTRDGVNGYLSSNRAGGAGSDDIYSFTYQPDSIPQKHIVKIDTPRKKPPVVPLKTTPAIVLNNIYYDLDKADIRPDAAIELDKLVVILNQHPAMKIELSSYTDSRASDEYNMALSQRRATAVVKYLVGKGIAASRLVARYYGETNLVNKCADDVQCTEAEQQLNRRTEFRVIGGD